MEFKQFNELKQFMAGAGEYRASATRRQGLSGIASASLHNRLFYQLSTMVTALADAITGKGYILEDDDIISLTDVLAKIMTENDMTPYALTTALSAYIAKSEIVEKTSEDILSGDFYKTVHYKSPGAISVGMPVIGTIPLGAWIKIKNIGAGFVTLNGGGSIKIDNRANIELLQYDEVVIQANKDRTEWHGTILSGSPSDWEASLTEPNGYQKFPSGLIMQWGLYPSTLTSEVATSITFPINFPSECLSMSVSGRNAPGTGLGRDMYPQVVSFTKTGASIFVNSPHGEPGGSTLDGYFWQAWGI